MKMKEIEEIFLSYPPSSKSLAIYGSVECYNNGTGTNHVNKVIETYIRLAMLRRGHRCRKEILDLHCAARSCHRY